jgi:tRNA wybutosine-synthesizing protein 3
MTVHEFQKAKEKAMRSLQSAIEKNEVDEGILPLLLHLNNTYGFYTSSSCAGRIVLLELPEIGDKVQATFLGKWHHPITSDILKEAIKKFQQGYLWLLAQSPILHVGCASLTLAEQLVKQAISCGFKNSGIKSLGKKIMVEVCSTERLDVPIGLDGVLFCTADHLDLLITVSNTVLTRSQKKLHRFEHNLREEN